MKSKFVIFVFMSTFLIAAVYNSSVPVGLAAETKCSVHQNGDITCVSGDRKKVSYCWHDPKTGRVAGCVTITAKTDLLIEALDGATIEGKPDKIFDEAMDVAIQESPNATKVGKPDFLEKGGLLEEGNNTKAFPLPPLGFDFKFLNNTDGDDETEVPEDRQDLLEEDDSTEGDDETEVPDDIDGLQDEEEE
jgi:hypothetical protein